MEKFKNAGISLHFMTYQMKIYGAKTKILPSWCEEGNSQLGDMHYVVAGNIEEGEELLQIKASDILAEIERDSEKSSGKGGVVLG